MSLLKKSHPKKISNSFWVFSFWKYQNGTRIFIFVLFQVALNFLLVRGTDKNSFISLLFFSLQRDNGKTEKYENRWRWHHMLGVFFCFPTGRWEVSGKLAKKVWAYIENLHVYLLFQICNGKKIVNIYWNHHLLKGRKNLLWQRPVLNEKIFYKFSTTSRQKPVIICSGLGRSNGEEKTMLREKGCVGISHNAEQRAQNSRTKSKEPIQVKGWRKTKGSPECI